MSNISSRTNKRCHVEAIPTFSLNRGACVWPVLVVLCFRFVLEVAAQEVKSPRPELDTLMRKIGEAQRRSDEAVVIALADQAKKLLGPRAGQPEKAATIRPVPPDVRDISDAEITVAFSAYAREISRHKWWRIGDDPTRLERPLRD